MRNRLPNLWTLGGLSLSDLLRRTVRESWQDEVFGQGGRMAFYHFLAIFPSLLVFFIISARVPHLGDHMKTALQDLSTQVLPTQVSQLLQEMMDELNQHTRSGVHLISIIAGALWAALNGTWAMIYGLNTAYEVEEHRSWWQLAVTIVGLTLFLAVIGSMAVFLIFCSAYLQAHLHEGTIALRVLEWLVLAASLSFSFAVLYRFAPNLRDHEWRWSTPGALCAVILWIGSTLGARLYFEHVNNYARSYGHLNGVVMLLLWLYVSNGAILIGGEMNSEIAKAVAEGPDVPDGTALRRDRS
jgi:membrane protein